MDKLRDVRPRDAIAAMQRADGELRPGGKGNHINTTMPNRRIVTFSGRREPIKIGLPKAMPRKADLPKDGFVRLLERGR